MAQADTKYRYDDRIAKRHGLVRRLKNIFLIQKLNNTVGILLLLAAAVFISFGIAIGKVSFAAGFIGLCVALVGLSCIFVFPKFALTVLIVLAYFLFELGRWGIEGPIGTIMDGLQVIIFITILARQKEEQNWKIFASPVTTVIIFWMSYNIIEVVNPASISSVAWFYTVRSVAFVQICYFSFVYYIRSVKMLRFIIKLWIVLAVTGALYGLKQEFIGFTDAENAYLHSDPNIEQLLYIAGHWRKFSFFSDPVAFAYNMAMPCVICICIMAGPFKGWKKIVSMLLFLLYFISALYSGTRGASVLVPAALLLFAILNYSKTVLFYSLVAAFCFMILIKIPTSNSTIYRFQTAFNPSNDASYNTRQRNQKRIQPYILTHPMGGGLGSTGTWGERFAPDSYLAHFPPDSGYIRVAVEDGWIGLLLFCMMIFVILKVGIDNFYSIIDPELKSYCLMAVLIVFTYNVANFPQEALVQYPSNILFNLSIALIVITKRVDTELQKKKQENLYLQPVLESS